MENLPVPRKKEFEKKKVVNPEDIEIWRPTKPMTVEEIMKEMEKAGVRPLALEELPIKKIERKAEKRKQLPEDQKLLEKKEN
ncbi:MAG: hypothetical protein Q8P76_02280 [bacterium]|nr:hypothetical protein [bacterium]